MARLSFADHLKTSPGGPPKLSHLAVRHEKATLFSLQNPSVQHKKVSVQHKKVSVQHTCWFKQRYWNSNLNIIPKKLQIFKPFLNIFVLLRLKKFHLMSITRYLIQTCSMENMKRRTNAWLWKFLGLMALLFVCFISMCR